MSDTRPTRFVPYLAAALAAILVLTACLLARAQDDAAEPNVDAAFATVLWDAWADVYTDWPFEAGVPEGYYVGAEPHGMVLRTFVNDIAAADIEASAGAFSEGAVLIKENHAPTGVDLTGLAPQTALPDFDGDLRAWTWMVKVPGYAPETGDWFWGRFAADGSLLAAGSPQGCVACHAQVQDNDWVFNASIGD